MCEVRVQEKGPDGVVQLFVREGGSAGAKLEFFFCPKNFLLLVFYIADPLARAHRICGAMAFEPEGPASNCRTLE